MRAKRFGFAGLAAVATVVAAAATVPAGCAQKQARAPKPPPAEAKPLEPCPKPQPLKLGLTASPRLNPGEKGEALATVVRVYQLKGVSKLTGVSFDDLLDHDKEALGDDFLAMQEATINPGEALEAPIARNAETTYLLAVALFRRPAGTTWKVVRKLSPPDPYHCHATADRPRVNDGTVRFFLDENRIELR
jgi:type VI secretion system VasD/TssJ family lipoprotein